MKTLFRAPGGIVAAAAILTFFHFCTAALAEAPKPIDDPDKFSAEIMRMTSAKSSAQVAKTIAESVGQPSQTEFLQKNLQPFDAQHFDFTGKVVDNKLGDGLRQIVYYANVEKMGFVYFRFNFKRSSRGWILSNFLYKSEANDLLPKDFVDR